MKPSIGRIVHYILTEDDVLATRSKHGNPHHAGQHVPMIIVVVWPNEYGPNFDGVNGQVFLDGTDSLWITSKKEGTEPGTWHWPENIEE